MKKLTSYLSLLAVVSVLFAGASPANAVLPATGLAGFSPNPATFTNPDGTVVNIGGNAAGVGALPAWFQDQNGVAVKPCLDVLNCGLGLGGVPDFNPLLPMQIAPGGIGTNFPSEAFFFNATASFVMPGASSVLIVMALEYTFVTPTGLLTSLAATPLANGNPFQRLRLDHTFTGGGGNLALTVPPIPAGGSFTVTTPWGVTIFPVSGVKCVNSGGDTKCSVSRDLIPGISSPTAALGLGFVAAPDSTISSFLKSPAPSAAGFLGSPAGTLAYTGGALGNTVTVVDPLGRTSGPIPSLKVLIGQTVGLEVTAPAGTNFGVVKPAGGLLKTINVNNLAGVAFTPVIVANVPASNPVAVSPDFTIVPSAVLPCPTGIATLAIGANCNFDVAFSPIGADGPRSATISITGTGVPPATATVTGIADGTAPVLALISPKFVNTAAAQALSGTASDANGIGAVTVSVDGGLPAPATVTGGTWTFTTPVLAAQDDATGLPVHNIVVNANDTALPAPGNAATSLTPTIVVDATPPVVSLTLQDAGITTKNASPVLTFGATDRNLAVTVVKVDGTIVTPPPGSGAPMIKLPDGKHTIRVEATDSAGNIGFKEAALTIDTIVSPFTLKAVTTPTKDKAQIISGTVEAGSTVNVAVGTAAAVAATVTGTTWSAPNVALVEGVNKITVTATDAFGNTGTLPSSITVIFPDGKITGDASGVVVIADALKSLQFATGLVKPTPEETIHADVAPLVGGVPSPNGKIDIGDVVVILRKVVDPKSW
jgi:Bacterial Ig-like domain